MLPWVVLYLMHFKFCYFAYMYVLNVHFIIILLCVLCYIRLAVPWYKFMTRKNIDDIGKCLVIHQNFFIL